MTQDEIIEAQFEEVGPKQINDSRALVALVPPAEPHAKRLPFSFRSDASFVTQLIAAAANVPQTRGLRRASPEDAMASYRGTITRARDTAPMGTTTSRTV